MIKGWLPLDLPDAGTLLAGDRRGVMASRGLQRRSTVGTSRLEISATAERGSTWTMHQTTLNWAAKLFVDRLSQPAGRSVWVLQLICRCALRLEE